MSISVIIPTYNGASRLKTLLNQLLSWEHLFELIVVDDGSTDDTDTILKTISDHRLVALSQPNRGRASARNAGVKVARGQIVWFLDDDMTVEADYLKKISKHFNEFPGSILVGGQFEKIDQCTSDIQQYKAYNSTKWQRQLGRSKKKLSRPYITAANFAIEKRLFQSLKGFDGSLRDTEDYDLALRAANQSIDIYFDPEIRGYHAPITNAVVYARRLKEYHDSEQQLRILKPELNMTFPYRPTAFKRWIYSLFYSERWLIYIDQERFHWMPRKGRYWLYSLILTAHARVKGDRS